MTVAPLPLPPDTILSAARAVADALVRAQAARLLGLYALATVGGLSGSVAQAQTLPTPTFKGLTISQGNIAARTAPGAGSVINADTTTTATNVYGPGSGSICAGCTTYDALQVSIALTAGTTVTGTNAFAGYLLNKGAQIGGGVGGNGVVFFGAGVSSVDNAGTWGINTTLSDAPEGSGVTAGVGRKLIGYEADFGSTSPNTIITGISMLGSSTAQPAGANAFVVGSLSVQNPALTKWTHSFVSTNGVSSEGLFVGALETSGSTVPGQPITFNYFSPAGVEEYYRLQAPGNGSISFIGSNPATAGLGINGPIIATGFLSQANADSLIAQVGHGVFYANGVGVTSVAIGNSTNGSTTPISINGSAKLLTFAVSTLPTCNATHANALVAVTDATAPTYNGALTGGGAVHVPVFCNGVNWTAH